ncbi:hypothetical protein TCAL_15459 [Tigriopus californicus]|uniref:Uncharacterized protein n=1 Tax=Tigriopus californicus TaxID=6832 RepID=A0A553PRN3_TIGCA|nr:hypothetical protein TCAL_15459 [Tigriopus californicus]
MNGHPGANYGGSQAGLANGRSGTYFVRLIRRGGCLRSPPPLNAFNGNDGLGCPNWYSGFWPKGFDWFEHVTFDPHGWILIKHG